MDSNTYRLFFLYNLQGCVFTSDHSVTVCNPQLLVKGTIVTETVASETYNCVTELGVVLEDKEGLCNMKRYRT